MEIAIQQFSRLHLRIFLLFIRSKLAHTCVSVIAAFIELHGFLTSLYDKVAASSNFFGRFHGRKALIHSLVIANFKNFTLSEIATRRVCCVKCSFLFVVYFHGCRLLIHALVNHFNEFNAFLRLLEDDITA